MHVLQDYQSRPAPTTPIGGRLYALPVSYGPAPLKDKFTGGACPVSAERFGCAAVLWRVKGPPASPLTRPPRDGGAEGIGARGAPADSSISLRRIEHRATTKGTKARQKGCRCFYPKPCVRRAAGPSNLNNGTPRVPTPSVSRRAQDGSRAKSEASLDAAEHGGPSPRLSIEAVPLKRPPKRVLSASSPAGGTGFQAPPAPDRARTARPGRHSSAPERRRRPRP